MPAISDSASLTSVVAAIVLPLLTAAAGLEAVEVKRQGVVDGRTGYGAAGIGKLRAKRCNTFGRRTIVTRH